MILPVPYTTSVRFHDLSKYADLFEDCERDFMKRATRGLAMNASQSFDATPLPVFDVGSYRVSLAHNLADLDRVDPSVFVMNPECSSMLRHTYPESQWGFIICQLRPGNHKYHPFAWSHALLPNGYFIPTKHFHKAVGPHITVDPSMADDWSHTIYIYNGVRQGYPKYAWNGQSHVQSAKLQFPLGPVKNFERVDITGTHPNIDLRVPVAA
jgi:hypothetical protein